MSATRNRTLLALLWLVVTALALVMLMLYVDRAVSGVARMAPETVVAVFAVITVFGYSWLYWAPAGVLFFVFLALSQRPTPRMRTYRWAAEASAFVFAAVAGSSIIVGIIKRVVGRARPYVELPTDSSPFAWFVLNEDLHSFPSGHADTFLSVATVLSWLCPRWRWPILLAGVVGAFSRVVLHVHYVSDVLVGGAIGVGVAYAMRVWFADRGWAFRRRRDGSIRLKPAGRWTLMRVRRRLLRRRA
ncbi:MAG TPA: phosphatase PAP2 family protein [Azospirillum sp.]|nr:phosphatase PAP2 family protein [Azospirillum sp.]